MHVDAASTSIPPSSPSSRALAHRWWDPDSEISGRCTRSIRCGSTGSSASRGGLAGKRVLDVGCGGGILAEAMAARGAQVTGIDLSATRRSASRRLHQLESGAAVDYRLVAAEALAAEAPASFDVVTCMEMLEHVPDPASTVAACAALAQARRHRRVLDDQPQPEVVRCSRSSAPSTCCGCCRAARTTTRSSSGRPSSPRSRAAPASTPVDDHRHDLQPADARSFASSRTRRSTT